MAFIYVCRSGSGAENGRDYSRIAPPMQYRNYRQGFFLWRVSDHILANGLEEQWACGEVRAAVAYARKRDKGMDRFVDFFRRPIGSVQAVASDVFPDLVKIGVRFWVENKFAHEPARRSLLFNRSLAKASSPSTGFTRPLLRSS